MKKKYDILIGDVYNSWTLLEPLMDGMWRCQCVCGEIRDIYVYNVISGKSKSCGCQNKLKQVKDITGQIFGRLTVIRMVGFKNHLSLWECRCECGAIKIFPITYLTTGDTKSCGCYRKDKLRELYVKDLVGETFGRLTVLERVGLNSHQKTLWRCKCRCGNIVTVIGSKLQAGWTKSCGCILVEKSKLFYPSVSATMFLDKLQSEFGICIEREYYLERRFFDGRIGSVLIEIDCVYWHKDHKDNDALKDEIALRNGFSIVHMNVEKWEDVQQQFDLYSDSFEKVLTLHKIAFGE